jgi:hypothetical protein
LLTFCAATTLAGCDTTSTAVPYSAATPNVIALQTALRPSNTKLNVGGFEVASGVSMPSCRLVGSLDPTSGKPVQEYLKAAFQTELMAAQALDTTAGVTLQGTVTEVKMDSIGGSWKIGIHVSSNIDAAGYDVSVDRSFKTSYVAVSACKNATDAFAPTVQELVGKVVADPGFAKLIGRT